MTAVVAAVLAPLLPGLVQTFKARLQGRRGASPLQPYRVLRRLWGKSAVDPQGSGPVYRTAPAVATGAALCGLAIVPIGGWTAGSPLGHDALLLGGLLALARFAAAAGAWDTGNGFALMGTARLLVIAVFGEALLVLAVLVAALPALSTDLDAMGDAAAGGAIWGEPAHWCGALAFALVALVETGRQPIDNPDTHLELTLIEEGPLLEYAGRDLAYLQWVGAARHWVVLVLAVDLFLPHPDDVVLRLLLLPAWLVLLCAGLAVCETAQAKMRILRVPGLLVLGCLVALVGAGSWIAGGGT
jgi:formate hydrogenlyase subunit 4